MVVVDLLDHWWTNFRQVRHNNLRLLGVREYFGLITELQYSLIQKRHVNKKSLMDEERTVVDPRNYSASLL
jgi:hypothetical protein